MSTTEKAVSDLTFADFMASSRELLAIDTCDRCGAQAYVLVTLPNGGELLFCVHHFKETDTDKLALLGATVSDQSRKLAEEVKKIEK